MSSFPLGFELLNHDAVPTIVHSSASRPSKFDLNDILSTIEHAGVKIQELEGELSFIHAQARLFLSYVERERNSFGRDISELQKKNFALEVRLARADEYINQLISERNTALSFCELASNRIIEAEQKASLAEERARVAEGWLSDLQEVVMHESSVNS